VCLVTTTNPAKTVEQIEMPFSGASCVPKETCIGWCQLANTIERSVRDGDAAIVKITLTSFVPTVSACSVS